MTTLSPELHLQVDLIMAVRRAVLIWALDLFLFGKNMKRRIIFNLLLMLLIFFIFSQILAKGKSRKEKIVGTVIAYNQLSPLVCITDAPCQVTLIIRIDGKDKKQNVARFIQVTYQYYSSDEMNKGFPVSLVEGKRRWRFQLTRDSKCDAPIMALVPAKDEKTGKETDLAVPIWRAVEGAEDEEIPIGKILPCYRLKFGDYKPYKG